MSKTLVPGAKQGLSKFKYEVANQIGVQAPNSGYWGEMTSRECGSVGGEMVKRMVEQYENSINK